MSSRAAIDRRPPDPEALESLRNASSSLLLELGLALQVRPGLGVSLGEYRAMLELERHRETSAESLSKLLGVAPDAVGRTIRALVKKALVRSKTGARNEEPAPFALTAKGRRLLARARARDDASLGRALALLSPKETSAMIHGASAFASVLRRARLDATLSIRPIARKDDPEVRAIIHRVMPEFGASGPGFAIEDPEVEAMFHAYRGPKAGYFVLVDGRRILGGAGFARLEGGPTSTCELRKMYFLPEARGLGMGAKLLRHVLLAARDAGYEDCYLETLNSMTRAKRLYEAFGFTRLCKPQGATGHFGCDTWYSRSLLDLDLEGGSERTRTTPSRQSCAGP